MNWDQVTAFHEAGHAIAARMRGARVVACSVDPGLTTWRLPQVPQKLFLNGQRITNPEPVTRPKGDGFIHWAGSWAEVRSQLPTSDPRFAGRLAATLNRNTTDNDAYVAADRPEGIEAQWSLELEQHWPYIARVANALYREHVERVTVARAKRTRIINRRSSRYRYQELKRAQKRREVENLPPVAS